MDKVLGEQKLQLSGCVSGECIVEAGQLLGVGKIITGSVSMVGKTYYLSLSLINVESGEIEKSSEDECKCELEDLIQSSKRLVKRLLAEEVAETKTTPEPTPKPAEAKSSVIASETKQSQKPSTTTDTSGIETVFVKGGCYQMGCGSWTSDCYDNEKPVHEVCVDDFYIGKYEVTVGEFRKFVNDTGYKTEAEKGDGCYIWNGSSWNKEADKNWRNVGFSQDENHPVACVSWNDATAFTGWLVNKTGKSYRLPTEAEWEYAARSGGKSEKYAGGNDVDIVAWYTSNSGNKTHPVGQKAANGLGIYDMSGNVWEWVNDWYDESYYKNSPKNNPKGPNSGSNRVGRGGCWYSFARGVRASSRYYSTPVYRRDDLGLRLAGPVK